MATNPDSLLPPSREQTPPTREQQAADIQALAAAGRAEMRKLIDSRAATFDDLNAIAVAYGMAPLNRADVEPALRYAANPDNDPRLVAITHEIRAAEPTPTAEPTPATIPVPEASIVSPDQVAATQAALALPDAQRAALVDGRAPQPTLGTTAIEAVTGLAPNTQQAMAQAFTDYLANEPRGLDPENLRMFGAEPGNTQGLMGLTNRIILAPVSAAAAGLEYLTAAGRAGLAGAGQALYDTDLGGRSALERMGDLFNPDVKVSPERFAADIGEAFVVGGLPLGAQVSGIPFIRSATPASRGRMANTLQRARPAPLNLADELAFRPTRVAQVAADTTLPPLQRAARPAAAAPEVPPVPVARSAAAAAAPDALPPVAAAPDALPPVPPAAASPELAPFQPNFSPFTTRGPQPLRNLGPTMYREVSVDQALYMLPQSGRSNASAFGDEIFLSTSRDLALGQGDNTGVMLEFDALPLEGAIDFSKPSAELAAAQRQAEVIWRGRKESGLAPHLQAVTIAPNATISKTNRFVLDRTLRELESEGWKREVLPDGSTRFSRTASAAAAAPEVPPVPPRAAAAAPEVPPVPPRAAAPNAPPPGAAAAAPDLPPISAEQRAEDAFNLDEVVPPRETQPILTIERRNEIAAYQEDYVKLLQERGYTRPKNMPLSEWIQVHMLDETIPVQDLLPLWQRHNITGVEDQLFAAGVSRESLSRAGRELNRMSQLERMLQRVALENPQAAQGLGIAAGAIRETRSIYNRLMSIESGLLTTQLKTIVRNTFGALPIMPTYALIEELTDASIRAMRNTGRADDNKLLGPAASDVIYSALDQLAGPLIDAARGTANIGRAVTGRGRLAETARQARDRRTIEALRNAFPTRNSKLFGRYSADQLTGGAGSSATMVGRTLNKMERAVDLANFGNRAVDRWVKNAQFPAILDLELRRIGRKLDDYLDTDTFNEIPKATLDAAITRMHKRVFSDQPEGAEWYNSLSRSFINLINYSLRPAGLAPFPNFWVSIGKHLFETSPAAIVRFASKAERTRIAEGDARAVGKIFAGLAVTAAYYLSKDYDDGTEWFETKASNGEIIDVSAASAPMLLNSWEAYLIHMAQQGRLNEVQWMRDIAKIAGNANLRSGFSGYMVDSGFKEVIDSAERGDSASQVQGIAERYFASRVGSWTLMLRNMRDAASVAGTQDQTQRQPQTPAQGVAMNLPFGAELYQGATGTEIPARFTPTRAEATQDPNPLLSQFTGALIRSPRNPLEERMINLGMTNSQINDRSGISDRYDRLLTAEMGRLVEERVVPNLEERIPSTLSPERQRLRLLDTYTRVRRAARDNLAEQYPIYTIARSYDRLKKDERRLRDQANVQDPQRGRAFPAFLRDIERIDPAMPVVDANPSVRRGQLSRLAAGTTYADALTYTVRVKE